jgi:hypothetical protein
MRTWLPGLLAEAEIAKGAAVIATIATAVLIGSAIVAARRRAGGRSGPVLTAVGALSVLLVCLFTFTNW